MEAEEEKESSISMVEAKLPPGFRFHPKDDELVCDYLMRRSLHINQPPPLFLIQVDLNKCEPWDIPRDGDANGETLIDLHQATTVLAQDSLEESKKRQHHHRPSENSALPHRTRRSSTPPDPTVESTSSAKK